MFILSLQSAFSGETAVQNNQIIRENFPLPEECQQINVKENIELENHHFTTNDSTKYHQWLHKTIRGKVNKELIFNVAKVLSLQITCYLKYLGSTVLAIAKPRN